MLPQCVSPCILYEVSQLLIDDHSCECNVADVERHHHVLISLVVELVDDLQEEENRLVCSLHFVKVFQSLDGVLRVALLEVYLVQFSKPGVQQNLSGVGSLFRVLLEELQNQVFGFL